MLWIPALKFCIYAFLSVSSIMLIRLALTRLTMRRVPAAAGYATLSLISFMASYTSLLWLLSVLPVSTVTPIAVGLNIALMSVATWVFLSERVEPVMAAGMLLIVAGVTLVFSGG